MLKTRFILPILIIACFTAEVRGQSYISFNSQLNRILETTRYQIGPFRLFPTIRLRQFGYDNNIFRRYGDPVGDFTFTVSPELDTYLIYKESLILSFLINPEYVFYYKQNDLRGWNRSFSPELKWRIINGFILSGSYVNSTTRQRPSSEFSERVNFTIRGYSVKFFYERPNNLAIGISFKQNKMKYSEVSEPSIPTSYARLNREENFLNLEFYYPIFRDSSFFLRFGYMEYNFDYLESQEKNSYSYQIISGIGFPLLGKMRGTLSLGYQIFKPRDKDLKGFFGLIGDTSLEYRVSQLSFRIIYSRNTPFSVYQTSIYYIENRFGGGISFYLTRYIRLDYNVSYGIADYPETTQIPSENNGIEEINRRDKYITQNAAIVFRLIGNSGLGFSINVSKRNSNIPITSFQNIFIGVFFTLDF